MNTIPNIAIRTSPASCLHTQPRQHEGDPISCITSVTCTHYASLRIDMTVGKIGRHAGKRIAAYLKQCGPGYDTAVVRRQEGRCIAATLQRQESNVNFKTQNPR